MTAGIALNIEIRRFGRDGREMVGVLQRARDGAPRKPSFLLCRPFGQEATRTASMFRVLSDRLAREGCDVLTFDYHGTGDSPGDEIDQSLLAWVDDVQAAHEELCSPQGTPLHWFAMGLGATIAARAAARVTRPPASVVLWEPVLNGASYLQALFSAHRDELAREFHYPWTRLLRQGRVEEPKVPGDVLGSMIGAALTADLNGLTTLALAPALRRGIRIVCGVHQEQRENFEGLSNGSGGLFGLQTVQTRTNWLSSQAMGTAMVPPEVPRTLIATFA